MIQVHRFLRYLLRGGIIVSVLVLTYCYLFNFSIVRGTSMSPTIFDGDRILVDRVALLIGTPIARNEIVVMSCPSDPRVDYIKRVIGLPGDLVEIDGGKVRINGAGVREPFTGELDERESYQRWEVPVGQYFVLGDNRRRSCDSRYFGMVDQRLIKGKVRFCFWPPDRIGSY